MTRRSRLIVSLLSLTVSVAACGRPSQDAGGKSAASPTAEPSDSDQLYEAVGLVLDTPKRGPELCLGGVEESAPPQCGGIPIEGWDWSLVDYEGKPGDTRWADVHVVGTYDGKTFTVHEAQPPEEFTGESESVGTPCPEPEGGWTATDPRRAAQEDVVTAQAAMEREPDFAGLWVDYYDVPPGELQEEDPGSIILNVAFTGDLERHEEQLRELWGGPLCLSRYDHTYKELHEIQRDFPADELDVDVLWSYTDVPRGEVVIGVIYADAETLERIDDRYGEGVVRLQPALNPVD